ncbi:MAG: PolC-type DNA polymerase III [Erysipelotrichaceae bacterium]|jgi:DNA polymerase-3 subunit alpha (Gram-positive type)|nr:PolC-type DNA polymerase III [Erysipelotrichaceae bacterium]
MDQRITRFLNSIGLTDSENWDLDFKQLRLDKTTNTYYYHFLKNSFWDYHDLMRFLQALTTVSYNLEAEFEYQDPNYPTALRQLVQDFISDKSLQVEPEDTLILSSSVVVSTTCYELLKQHDFFLLLDKINYENIIEARDFAPISEYPEEGDVPSDDTSDIDINDIEFEESDSYSLENDLDDSSSGKSLKKMSRSGHIKAMKIKDIKVPTLDLIDVRGTIFSIEEKHFPRKGSSIFTIGLEEDEQPIFVKLQTGPNPKKIATYKELKVGDEVRVAGKAIIDQYFDPFEVIIKSNTLKKLKSKSYREDKALKKRVELHLHTRMSQLDGVGDIEDYFAFAYQNNHSALAITDHGVLQGFPEAQRQQKKYRELAKKENERLVSEGLPPTKNDLKVLYGVELYVINDLQKIVYSPQDVLLKKATYVILDLETTGLSNYYDRIIEFGGYKVHDGRRIDELDIVINPERTMTEFNMSKHRLTNEQVRKGPVFRDCYQRILDFIGDAIIVTHNAKFDIGFLNAELARLSKPPLQNPVIDTLMLSRYLIEDITRFALGNIARYFKIPYDEVTAHNALVDAEVLAAVFEELQAIMEKKLGFTSLLEIDQIVYPERVYKIMHPNHLTLLVKNEVGLKKLYELISYSHTKVFAKDLYPLVPLSRLLKDRDDYLLGSACFDGLVFEAASEESDAKLEEMIGLFDYIELQPLDHYDFLVATKVIDNKKQVRDILDRIIKTATALNKMIVATGDVHYLDLKDKKYRDIFVYAKGKKNSLHPLNPRIRNNLPKFENANQEFKTTEEMLEEFSFLGPKMAETIVITNPNKIADMCQFLNPIPEKLHPPIIPNSDHNLKEICFRRLHEVFGKTPHPMIEDRLNKELEGIISAGYSVTYELARIIIERANQDGYFVGSRGSVGSSLAAFLSGISEVNPLPPFYLCPHCQHHFFSDDSDIRSGFDLPSKNCPKCGTLMNSDGQNIPFATFLGFQADKIPDIDLNFPSDYQARSHNYLKTLFKDNHVYRAGTISTCELKTSAGYVRAAHEGKREPIPGKTMVDYLAAGCVGTKRTTGQHPGGLIIIPESDSIYDYTAIQFPGDDDDKEWNTTHYAFKDIHDALLKLDLLGHIDPLAIKEMGLIAKIDPMKIPMNDPECLKLFTSIEPLKMHSNLLNAFNGSLGIPEFGTSNARDMLKVINPRQFADLLAFSGLAHGTGVWEGNARSLIVDDGLTIRDVIGCRDDIMTYLINKKIPEKDAFRLMERIRKGQGFPSDGKDEAMLREHGVPDYYINSCRKIEYMFPKAHAAAYVIQAMRVAYFKIHYPLEYYSVYFGFRIENFDIEALLGGETAIFTAYNDAISMRRASRKKDLKLDDKINGLETALEMVQRGYRFYNIDLYKSSINHFEIDRERNGLILSFMTMSGLGQSAADSIIKARNEGVFISKKDILDRTKVNSTILENLNRLGVLKGLPDDNRLSLFDDLDIFE